MDPPRSPTVPIVAVVGPTATGKSDLAIAVAQALDGEVVNADAMQLYRGMDIGTAKVAPADRRVPHHQLDVLDVTQDARVAAYQQSARSDVADILARGRTPVVVGGSGLYLRALLDQLDFPATDPQVRADIERRGELIGPTALHAELAAHDPLAATALPPANTRRVVRALEVIELTGRPFSASMPSYTYARTAVQVGLRADLIQLDEVIARRVDRMWDQGLVAEVRELVQQGLRAGRTAPRAVGYAEVLEMLDRASVAGADAAVRAAVVTSTRQLVRRQVKWFRRDPRIHWLEVDLRGARGAERLPDMDCAPDTERLLDLALAVAERHGRTLER